MPLRRNPAPTWVAFGVAVAAAATAGWIGVLTRDESDAIHAAAVQDVVHLVFTGFLLAALGVVGRLALGLIKRWPIRFWPLAALVVGAIPVSSFLANLVPWWRCGGAVTRSLVYVVVTTGVAVGLAVVALSLTKAASDVGLAGQHRPPPKATWPAVNWQVKAAAGWIGLIGTLVILADGLTRSSLGWGAPMGIRPDEGFRFYGYPNSEFGFLVAYCLVAAAVYFEGVSTRLLTGAITVVAATVAFVDGAPWFGADFGGPIPIILAFAVFGALATGRRGWQLWPLLVAGLVALAGLVLICWLDYRRGPAAWTHLGGLIETVLDGGLGSVIGSKLRRNLLTMTLPYALPTVILVWAAMRFYRQARRLNLTARWRAALPLATPTTWALLAAIATGAAINDAGLGMAGFIAAPALTLLAAALAQPD